MLVKHPGTLEIPKGFKILYLRKTPAPNQKVADFDKKVIIVEDGEPYKKFLEKIKLLTNNGLQVEEVSSMAVVDKNGSMKDLTL